MPDRHHTPPASSPANHTPVVPTERSAVISPCGVHRYSLTRSWAEGPTALFIMLNPSTADGTEDDPTIRRCVGFARRFGCGTLVVGNLYSYRATQPDDLRDALEAGCRIVGPECNAHLTELVVAARMSGGPIVAGWGAGVPALHKTTIERAAWVRALADGALDCLGTTKAGGPRHPLYLRADAPLIPWPVAS